MTGAKCGSPAAHLRQVVADLIPWTAAIDTLAVISPRVTVN